MTRKLIVIGATILTLFSQLFSSAASAADDPPAEEVFIDVVGAYGSGCPPGTVYVQMRPGNAAFTVIYSEYVAKVGVGASVLDFRKNCQLNVLIRVPDGYTYALQQTGHHGHGGLAAGATGRQRASYYFQGSPNTDIRAHSFTGPLDDSWQTTDESDLPALEFHPCGELRNLNINTELRVSAGTSDPTTTSSVLAMFATDVHRLHWKRCP